LVTHAASPVKTTVDYIIELQEDKEEKTCEEYQSMVKDKVVEAEWNYFDVNEHWQQMKNIMMDTAQVTCGLSKGPCRHNETW